MFISHGSTHNYKDVNPIIRTEKASEKSEAFLFLLHFDNCEELKSIQIIYS